MSRYGLSSCGWRNLILFLRKMHMHKICSDSEFPTKAPHCFPFTLSPHTSIYERVWPRTKKMDWTKCRVTPDSGIFKQTLPWCHGDQEVELTAILADLHLVVCPNLPGEAPAWPVTTVSGPNNTGISLGKKKKNKKKHTQASGGLLSKQDEQCQTLRAPTFHNHFLDCHFSLFGPANRRRWEASWPVV